MKEETIKLKNGGSKRISYFDYKELIIQYKIYYNSNNHNHREEGPASLKYYKSGMIEYKDYFINGKSHRTDGPSYTSYYKNGNIEIEQYWVNNKRHRLSGPADIWHYKSGKIKNEHYWINDIKYSKEEYNKHPEVIKFININRNLKLLNKK